MFIQRSFSLTLDLMCGSSTFEEQRTQKNTHDSNETAASIGISGDWFWEENPLRIDSSWDQMAEFDLPAAIDEILRVNGASRVYYVGHSQVLFD